MSANINCIITDDEPLARKGMQNFASRIPYLNVIATCTNAMETMDALKNKNADVIFLDIHMPQLSGIEMLKSLSNTPLTVITSAFPDYALQSYELNVIDYLVKPVSFERFVKSVNKVRDFISLKNDHVNESKATENFFFIKCDHRYEKVFYEEILFIQAMQNYVIIHTHDKRLITYLTIKGVEEYLPKSMFIKVNKSNIISLSKINSIAGDEVMVGEHEFSIGRNFKNEVMQVLNGRLLKRK